MITRTRAPTNPPAQLHMMAVGKFEQGLRTLRVAPRPANADVVLAAMGWGRRLFDQGEPRYHCLNEHEQAGYDEAYAEFEARVQHELSIDDTFEDEENDLSEARLDEEFWASGRW